MGLQLGPLQIGGSLSFSASITCSHQQPPFYTVPSPLIFSFAIVDPQLPALFFFCSALAVSQAAPYPEIKHGQQENS
jgi:hypothetical protein